jgi:hypothetical protein
MRVQQQRIEQQHQVEGNDVCGTESLLDDRSGLLGVPVTVTSSSSRLTRHAARGRSRTKISSDVPIIHYELHTLPTYFAPYEMLSRSVCNESSCLSFWSRGLVENEAAPVGLWPTLQAACTR